MEYQQPAVHRTIIVVDVEGFGDRRRTNFHQRRVRAGLYAALRQAFDRAEVAWSMCHREDRGDGVFILAPATVPKEVFVDAVPRALVTALREHNATHPAEEQIRLRMAVHAGEIVRDEHGVTSAAVNLAFRLLDAQQLKTALIDSPGVLAVITSAWFYEDVVRHSQDVDPATFWRVQVTVKETSADAWISLPDYPYAPVADHLAGAPFGKSAGSIPHQLPAADQPASSQGRRHVVFQVIAAVVAVVALAFTRSTLATWLIVTLGVAVTGCITATICTLTNRWLRTRRKIMLATTWTVSLLALALASTAIIIALSRDQDSPSSKARPEPETIAPLSTQPDMLPIDTINGTVDRCANVSGTGAPTPGYLLVVGVHLRLDESQLKNPRTYYLSRVITPNAGAEDLWHTNPSLAIGPAGDDNSSYDIFLAQMPEELARKHQNDLSAPKAYSLDEMNDLGIEIFDTETQTVTRRPSHSESCN